MATLSTATQPKHLAEDSSSTTASRPGYSIRTRAPEYTKAQSRGRSRSTLLYGIQARTVDGRPTRSKSRSDRHKEPWTLEKLYALPQESQSPDSLRRRLERDRDLAKACGFGILKGSAPTPAQICLVPTPRGIQHHRHGDRAPPQTNCLQVDNQILPRKYGFREEVPSRPSRLQNPKYTPRSTCRTTTRWLLENRLNCTAG